jgi:release factor glutamine methyltransferase
MMNSVYSPTEDSFLLQKYVDKLVFGRVLDMGTGSGVQAITAAKKNQVEKVVATDINVDAIFATKNLAKTNGVTDKVFAIHSDLFKNIHEKFNWIIFNPPYLPSEKGIIDATWDGGETGKEVIQRFLTKASNYLKENGGILLIYSSETNINENYGYKWTLLEELHQFYETIFCVLLEPLPTF